jgi:rhamnosyltransferase
MDEVLGVIVSYNPDIEILRKCVCSVVDQVSELLVIDNYSDNFSDIAALLEEIDMENVRLEHFPSNKGLSYAYNHAFEIAKDMGMEAVLTLDQDTICTSTLVGSLFACLEEDSVAIACPVYVDRNVHRKAVEDVEIKEVSSCINSGALIKVKAWELIGGYDEALFIDFNDYDFCLRITDKGYKIKQVTGEIISHEIGQITMHRLLWMNLKVWHHSATRKYYQSRNRFYLDAKYGGRKTELGNPVRRMLYALIKVWLWENDKRKKTAAIFRGARDGYRLGKRIYG